MKNKADAILTADWHLRMDNPICRTDNFIDTLISKMKFISELQKKHNCQVFHAGDLFHHWKPSPELLSIAIEHLPKQFCTVYGNHDLPQHNLELAKKSGIYLLNKAGILHLLDGTHWNQKVSDSKIFTIQNKTAPILIWHKMVWKNALPFPGCTESKALIHLKNHPQYPLIVTGDNHKAFVEELDGRILVNPGSLTRQSADQIDFKPRVYLWYAETNTVEPIYIPINKKNVTREHIETKQQRFDRVNAFVEKLDGDWEVEIEFEKNLETFYNKNNVRKSVKEIIYKGMGK